jgi:anti-anti-sigma factor
MSRLPAVCDNGAVEAEGDLFSLTLSELEPCKLLSVRGELDEVAAPVLDEAIDASADELLIVDLSGLEFICSAGIHALLRRRPGRAAIVCPPGNVARVLGIVRAEKTASLFEDVDAARDALSRPLAGVA